MTLPRVKRMGRLPDNPPGSKTESFILWPAHDKAVDEWARILGVNRSEAVRIMIEVAGPPTSKRAVDVASRLELAREGVRQKAIDRRATFTEARRAKKAEAARERRAREKTHK